MILVDTSVWIELLRRGAPRWLTARHLLEFATCGPVVQEVLQGIRSTPLTQGFEEAFLAVPRLYY